MKQKNSFKSRVLAIVSGIKEGNTLSYKEVAALAGSPNAARAVGNIMSRNSDFNIPCHRVIKSNGQIGGYNNLRGEKSLILHSERASFANKDAKK